MQLDMHYYATWCIARATGMSCGAATIAATAAQFVDDNAKREEVSLQGGTPLVTLPTAHHCEDGTNLLREDQWQVWVPFHFLPGNEGSDLATRLQCRMDSPLIGDVMQHHLKSSTTAHGLELIGITAHVPMDTYSHYGFSGLSADENKVISTGIHLYDVHGSLAKYLASKARRFTGCLALGRNWWRGAKALRSNGSQNLCNVIKTSLTSLVAEVFSSGLGHAGVLTYPDRPYLRWSFEYEDTPTLQLRDNPTTYMRGCKALYDLFTNFLKLSPGHTSKTVSPVPFKTLQPKLEALVKDNKAALDVRCAAWVRSAADPGGLFGRSEKIPAYSADTWKQDLKVMAGLTPAQAANKPAVRFFQAAREHRDYVLRELLPQHRLAT